MPRVMMLSVIMLRVIILNVVMLIVIILSVIMLSVIMLIVIMLNNTSWRLVFVLLLENNLLCLWLATVSGSCYTPFGHSNQSQGTLPT